MIGGLSASVTRSRHASDNGFSPRQGFEPFPEQALTRGIAARFHAVATRRPDAVALVDGTRRVTYGCLSWRARAIGEALAIRLASHPGPVGLQLTPGADAIDAILAVLSSGRPYLFLPAGPDALVHDIVRAAALAAVVTDADRSSVPDVASVPTIAIDTLRTAGIDGPAVDRDRVSDRACLFATSGTTGAPKIVGIPHQVVLFDIARQVQDLFLGPDDRIDLLCHPSFSASLSSIFSALLTGAELHLRHPAAPLESLGEWLAASGITITTMTVSSFRTLVSSARSAQTWPSLRLISLGGETVRDDDVRAFRRTFAPTCVLQNALASTETRTYAQYFLTHAHIASGPVPVGWPVAGKDITVVDDEGTPVPPGADGEVVVRSRYLADAYVNDPTLTAQRFHPHADGTVSFRTGDRARVRDDGCLLFLGRVDSLVKIRGHRVDTQAVEAQLRADPQLHAAAVVADDSAAGEARLVAFVVPAQGQAPTDRSVWAALADRLPAAAVPADIRVVEALPRNRNGKVDYHRLRQLAGGPVAGRTGADAPSLGALCDAWAFALDRPAADADTHFFQGGGDSLGAVRLQLDIHRRTGVEVSLATLVACPTPGHLATWLADPERASSPHPALVRLSQDGAGVPLFCLPGIGGEPLAFADLAYHVGRERAVFGLRRTLADEPPGETLTIEGIAQGYVDAIDRVLPRHSPVLLCGHSYGAIVALEVAHRLAQGGRRIGFLGVIDTPLRAETRTWMARLQDICRNLPGWLRYDALESDWSSLAARARGKSRDWWRDGLAALGYGSPSAHPDLRAYYGKSTLPPEVVAHTYARLDALRQHVCRPFDGTVVLFRARAQALAGRSDRALGWAGLARHVEVYDIPGHHDSCARPPHVAHLANALSRTLVAHGADQPQ